MGLILMFFSATLAWSQIAVPPDELVKNPTPQQRGGANGGGGDHNSQAFAKIGFDIATRLASQPGSIQIDTKLLQAAVSETEVEFTTEELSLDGVRKEARNYPLRKFIRVNQGAWDVMSHSAREALVLHEYLGIMKIDDTNYVISYKLLNFVAEKLVCEVGYDNGRSRDSRLSARSETIANTYPQPVFSQELVSFRMAKVLRLTWNLAEISKTPAIANVRNLRVLINSDRVPGTVRLNIHLLTADGEPSAARSRMMFLALGMFNPKGVDQGASLNTAFPIPPLSLDFSGANSRHGSVYCRVH